MSDFFMYTQSPALVADTILAIKAIVSSESFEWTLYAGALIGFVGFIVSRATGMGKSDSASPQFLLVGLVVLWVGAKSEVDFVVMSSVTGESYVITDAPGGIALAGYITTAIGASIRDLYAMQMSSAGGGDILAKNGVGRGLAVLQGLQGVRWTNESRNPFTYASAASAKYTDIEQSIKNYLESCYVNTVIVSGDEISGFEVFHRNADASSLTAIWERVKTDVQLFTRVKIQEASDDVRYIPCSDAWSEIGTAISSNEFRTALMNDAIKNMARSLAASSLPGSSSNLNPGGTSATAIAQFEIEATAMLNALFGGKSRGEQILFIDRLNSMLLVAYGAHPRSQNMETNGRLASAWDDAKRQSELAMAAKGDFWTRYGGPISEIIEIAIYAFLPIMLVFMFISSKGMSGILGLFGIYAWIQTWPIAHIIINHATTASLISSFDMYLTSTSPIGMEALYGMWDQVRKSYALSQFWLGVTPMLTGAIVSGSMMMLTKAIGTNNSFDEKRVYADTESSAPVYQTISSTGQFVGSDGSIKQNRDSSGTGTDLNVGQSLSQQITDSKSNLNTATQTLGRTLQRQVADNRANLTTEQLQRIIGLDTALSKEVSSATGAGGSQVIEQAKTWVESTTSRGGGNIGAQLGFDSDRMSRLKGKDKELIDGLNRNDAAAKEKAAKIAAGGGLEFGISSEVRSALTNTFKESNEFTTALRNAITTKDGFNVDKSTSDIVTATKGTTLSESEGFKNDLAKVEQAQRQYTNARSLSDNITATRTIDEGRQWLNVQRGAEAIMMAGNGLSGEDRTNAMRDAAQNMGLSAETSSRLVRVLDSGSWQDLAKANAGGYKLGSGVLNLLRSHGQGREWENFVIRNDDEVRGRQAAAIPNAVPVDNTQVDGNTLLEKAGEAAGVADDKTREIEPVAPAGVLVGEPAAQSAELESRVPQEIKKARELRARILQSQAELYDTINSKNDGNASPLENLLGGAESLNMRNGLGWAKPKEYLQDAAQARLGRAISLASSAYEQGKSAGLSEQELQYLVDDAMATMLTTDDQQKYSALQTSDSQAAASKYLDEKLKSMGFFADGELISSVSGSVRQESLTDLNGKPNIFSPFPGQAVNDRYVVASPTVMERLGRAAKSVFTGNTPEGDVNDQIARGMLDGYMSPQSGSSAYGVQAAMSHEAVGIYDKISAELASKRGNGEATLSDLTLAEVAAVTPYIAQSDEHVEKLDEFISKVRESAFGKDGGLMTAINGIVGGEDAQGYAVMREELENVWREVYGSKAGSFNEYAAQLPSNLQEKIGEQRAEILARHQQTINDMKMVTRGGGTSGSGAAEPSDQHDLLMSPTITR